MTITLWYNMTGIWEHKRSVENMRCRRVFSAFLEYRGNVVFYCDKPLVFDQSECVQGPVYTIIGSNKYLLLAKFKCSTVSYRPRFFLFNLWPKCEAWVPWIEVWITRCHNITVQAERTGLILKTFIISELSWKAHHDVKNPDNKEYGPLNQPITAHAVPG